MEDEKITTWYLGGGRPTPILAYNAVAERFGLKTGSKITDAGIYEQVIKANHSKS